MSDIEYWRDVFSGVIPRIPGTICIFSKFKGMYHFPTINYELVLDQELVQMFDLFIINYCSYNLTTITRYFNITGKYPRMLENYYLDELLDKDSYFMDMLKKLEIEKYTHEILFTNSLENASYHVKLIYNIYNHEKIKT